MKPSMNNTLDDETDKKEEKSERKLSKFLSNLITKKKVITILEASQGITLIISLNPCFIFLFFLIFTLVSY